MAIAEVQRVLNLFPAEEWESDQQNPARGGFASEWNELRCSESVSVLDQQSGCEASSESYYFLEQADCYFHLDLAH